MEITADTTMVQYAEHAYLQYAVAVVKGRALVEAEDGAKPVHRRILFSMHKLKLGPDAKPMKAAKVVGDVLGSYHPHGDSAVYEAMVRLAQDFSLRYPLVLGEGNWGTRDGDSAAAMRYTEAKLMPISRLLLDEINRGTVDFVPNYDGQELEPSLLPARLPFTLLNGSIGIAVGMAADMPSHNLREVAAACSLVTKNPYTTLDEVMQLIPGPDFPDGGQIISSPEDIKAVYTRGRGAIRVRSRFHREEMARGQWQLVFDELPYLVSCKNILVQIEELTNPKIPENKKTLSPQQINLRTLGLDLLERVNDESGKDHRLRLVVSPKNSKVSQEELLAYLFANTDLECNASVNNTCIGLNGNPGTMGLMQMLLEWSEFRLTTVRRRIEHDLTIARKRMHVLEGRKIVFLNLDEVIKIVRYHDEPKNGLIERFALSEEQAEDILDIRLRQLTRLDGLKLEKEMEELRAHIAELLSHVETDETLRALVCSEIEADSAKYGDDRRTLMKQEAKAQSSAAVVRSAVDEPVTVIVSKNLWVRARPGHGIDPAAITYREGDVAWKVIETRTSRPLVVMDQTGRSYSVRTSDLPTGRGDGVPLTTLIELQPGSRIQFALSMADTDEILFASDAGYGLKAPFKSLVASKRAGKEFLDMDAGVSPLPPVPLKASPTERAVCISSDGRMLAYPSTEIKLLAAGGKGVKLIELEEGGKLAHFGTFDGEALALHMVVKDVPTTFDLKDAEFKKYLMTRARKGCQLPKKGDVTGFEALSSAA
jgi:topoisomerase-4 subunit A